MIDLIVEEFNIENREKISEDISKFYVSTSDLKATILGLRDKAEFDFDMLLSIVAVDKGIHFELNYFLYSTSSNKEVVIALRINRESPYVDTISDIFPSANWDEREIFDLFGINFNLHPNLKRLLLPNDWIGFPLRKDYQNNDERLVWNR